MRKVLAWLAGTLAAVLLAAGVFVYSGIYNIAADQPHWDITSHVVEVVRTRSVERRSSDILPPDLSDPQRISKGAGQYAEMCVICHLAPGVANSPTRQGLNPVPPELHRSKLDPRAAFWMIKHGIKMTGMPAWGQSHDDEVIWDIVAFVERLPRLTPAEYRALVKTAPRDEKMDMSGMPANAGKSGASGRGDVHPIEEPAHK